MFLHRIQLSYKAKLYAKNWNKNLAQNNLLSKIKWKTTTTNVPEKVELNVKIRWTNVGVKDKGMLPVFCSVDQSLGLIY